MFFNNILNIFSLGTREHYPEHINLKIKTSNKVALFSILLVGLPFTIIFYQEIPELIFLPTIAVVITVLVPILNILGYQLTARTIASLSGTLTVGITHGFLVDKGNPPLPASMVFELAFSVMPFIVFHASEKKAIIGTALFTLIFVGLFQERIDFLEIDIQSIAILESQFMVSFSIILATVQIFFLLWIITLSNYKAELRQSLLVKEMNEKNDKLIESEKILKSSLQTLDESKIEEQRRLWITEGSVKFAKLLRTEDSEKLYDRVLAELIKYIKANQGAFYIVEAKDEALTEDVLIKQVSRYAYSRKKFTEQVLEPGEGLLGQCYFEKDIKLLTEIPEDYVKITSGIGEATPRSIVIIPLLLNDEVAGFIEMASFNVFEEHVITFLKRISESIASFIINNRINERSAQLLDKSQEQTEMMRAQEEEMRQNFEELQTTQEEMHRVQTELRNVKENLETELKEKLGELENYKNNIDVLMTTSQDAIIYTCGKGKIQMNNPRTIKMFGYKQEELNGMSINELLISSTKQVTDCFSEIKEGESKMFDFFTGVSKQYGFKFHTEIKLGKGKNNDGDVISIMVRDVSKRKKREESMQKNFAQMQKIQQTLKETQKESRELKSKLEAKEKELETLKKS